MEMFIAESARKAHTVLRLRSVDTVVEGMHKIKVGIRKSAYWESETTLRKHPSREVELAA